MKKTSKVTRTCCTSTDNCKHDSACSKVTPASQCAADQKSYQEKCTQARIIDIQAQIAVLSAELFKLVKPDKAEIEEAAEHCSEDRDFTGKAREAPAFRRGEESAGSDNVGTGLYFVSFCGSIVLSPEQDWASVKKPIAVRSRKGVLRKRNLVLQAPGFSRGVLTRTLYDAEDTIGQIFLSQFVLSNREWNDVHTPVSDETIPWTPTACELRRGLPLKK